MFTENPSSIRSAQIVDNFYPVMDGVVQAVHNYASIMNRRGYACVVAPETLEPFDDTTLPYDVVRTKSLKVKLTEYALPTPGADPRLRASLRERRLDLVHIHSPFTEGRFGVNFAKRAGIPSVATFHSKYYDDVMHVTGSKALARAVTAYIVNVYNHADSVWTVSEGAAEVLRTYGYRGDIRIMRNGTTFSMPENADELRRRAAETFDLPTDKHTLLFVGHLIWHKNLRLILDTFRLLCDHSDDYRLVIVGDGYDGEKIRSYADSLHFPEGAVRFPGHISDRELLEGVYLLSDLFFFPSLYDTSGLVVREAASLGVPSLLTSGSNAAEAVEKNVSGFTAAENKISMYREIVRIFCAEGLLERVSAAARRDIGRTWEQIIPEVLEQYADAIERCRFQAKSKA